MAEVPQEILDAFENLIEEKFNDLIRDHKINAEVISADLTTFEEEQMLAFDGNEKINQGFFRKFLRWLSNYVNTIITNIEEMTFDSVRYITPVDYTVPPDVGKIIAPFAHLVVTGAGVKPTLPDPVTTTADEAGFDPTTHLMEGGFAYNDTDNLWYYRGNDTIYELKEALALGVADISDFGTAIATILEDYVAAVRYITPVDYTVPPDCGKIIAPFAHLVVTGAGVKPTIPDPSTTTPDDAGFDLTSDIMEGGLAHNVTDNLWYYRSNDIIYRLKNALKEFYEVDALIDYGSGTSFTKATIDAALTAIGTVNKTTLLLQPGTWVIDATANWLAYTNVTFKIVPGAILQIATGTTTTIGGPLDVGLYQIFNCVGTGKVVFNAGSIASLYPQWWGAKGDDLTDSTIAIQSMFDAIPVDGLGIIPGGTYKITSLLDVDTANRVTIKFIGIITAYGCSGIKVSNSDYTKIDNLWVGLSARDWVSDFAGLEIYESANVKIDIKRIHNFQKGLALTAADDGISYGTFKIGHLQNNKYSHFYNISGTGWITENNFYGGRYTLQTATKAAETGSYAIYVINTSVEANNNNRYYSPCFESLHNGILFDYSNQWMILHPRYEDVDDNYLSGSVSKSIFVFGKGFDISKFNFINELSINNVFIGKENNNLFAISTESDVSGIGFLNYYIDHSLVGLLKSNAASCFLSYIDAGGSVSILNKGFEGTTSPAAGTYRTGAIIWNKIPASGVTMGWMCNAGGTMGILNSSNTTASGTINKKHITVNDVTGLYVGAKITIVGVTGAKLVQGIVGTTVYLTTTIDATVEAAAVAFSAATFIDMPNYP